LAFLLVVGISAWSVGLRGGKSNAKKLRQPDRGSAAIKI
jgi:hypothetical protein